MFLNNIPRNYERDSEKRKSYQYSTTTGAQKCRGSLSFMVSKFFEILWYPGGHQKTAIEAIFRGIYFFFTNNEELAGASIIRPTIDSLPQFEKNWLGQESSFFESGSQLCLLHLL